MAIKIKAPWDINTQRFQDGKGNRWVINSLIAQAKDLPVKEMPLEHLNIFDLHPRIESIRDFIGHIKLVMDADLDCPIILDDEGFIMDGRHRVAKALLEERETIKYVRFEKTPPPDYVVDEK